MSFPFQTEADAWFARISPGLSADEDDPGMGAFLARNERDLVELLRLKLEKDATAALLPGMLPPSAPPPQAYTQPTPAERWPGLATRPPKAESNYIDADEPIKWLRQHYIGGADKPSSRQSPAGTFPWALGTWQIASWPHGYGRWIEQLREVDPAELVISEETAADRLADVDTYADWMKAGKVAPPVSVSTLDDGRLKLAGDGHRRRLAAIKAGVKLLAWVGDAVLSGQLAAHGTPMYTLLTFELVNPTDAAGLGGEHGSLRYERVRNLSRARAAWRAAASNAARPAPPAAPAAPHQGRSVWTAEAAQKAEEDLARARSMVLAGLAQDPLLRATQDNTPHNLRQALETVVRRHVRSLTSAARDDVGLWTALVRLSADDEVHALAEAFIQQPAQAAAPSVAPTSVEAAPRAWDEVFGAAPRAVLLPHEAGMDVLVAEGGAALEHEDHAWTAVPMGEFLEEHGADVGLIGRLRALHLHEYFEHKGSVYSVAWDEGARPAIVPTAEDEATILKAGQRRHSLADWIRVHPRAYAELGQIRLLHPGQRRYIGGLLIERCRADNTCATDGQAEDPALAVPAEFPPVPPLRAVTLAVPAKALKRRGEYYFRDRLDIRDLLHQNGWQVLHWVNSKDAAPVGSLRAAPKAGVAVDRQDTPPQKHGPDLFESNTTIRLQSQAPTLGDFTTWAERILAYFRAHPDEARSYGPGWGHVKGRPWTFEASGAPTLVLRLPGNRLVRTWRGGMGSNVFNTPPEQG